MYQLIRETANRIEMKFSGHVTHSDIDQMSSDLNRFVTEHDRVRILCHMSGWRGDQGLNAMGHDLKLDLRYNPTVERFALVGDKQWQQLMAKLMKPAAHGEVRYFDEAESEHARAWIAESAEELP